ncbi:MAG: cobalamin biosynthesis protein CbiM [Chitinivibrionales bacterium]|nr:cobalamin biosynthesis protein CbiM [Chitinivibrionales bacterium]
MHMSDALVSPAVGGALWAASAGLIAVSARKVNGELDEKKVPLMGVAGAFIFAAQMINFSIPGTGSSGHLGGGMILAVLLGPWAAMITIASVLVIQALFFADGGLLALGCNIFNLGFFPAFVAYPFIYKPLAGNSGSRGRIIAASVLSSIVALQAGAFAVVVQTVFSGISSLPFGTFSLVMQPIHLAIGLVEGIVTAAVVVFVARARPDIVAPAAGEQKGNGWSIQRIVLALVVVAAVIGGALSWFASADPDGLEWAIAKTTGREEVHPESPSPVYGVLESLQEKLAFLPGYGFRQSGAEESGPAEESWPAVDPGASVAGIIGAALTLLLALAAGIIFHRKSANRSA